MALDLDWTVLDANTETKRTRYKFSDVQHQMTRVAFDVFKQNGDDSGHYWELREEDGTKYLYAVYDEPVDLTATSQADPTNWTATADRDGKNVSLSFKNIPLVRFASAEHGFAQDEAEDFAKFLQLKSQDEGFVAKLAQMLPETKKAILAELVNGSKT